VGTGIVFVVLVAIWVAYFVQYWSRRREHLATARSVEAFSEAMRVLERRPVLRAPSDDRISTAYAVSPARVVGARPAPRPQVIAKPHAPTKPSPSRGGVPHMSSPSARPAHAPARRSGTSPASPPPAGRPARSRSASVSPNRRVRGLVLLGSLATTVVLGVLVVVNVLLPWVPLLGVAAIAGSFLWLRAGVRAEQAARRATGRRRRARQPVQRSGQVRSRVSPTAAADAGSPVTTGQVEDEGLAGAVGDAELVERTEVTAQSRPDGWQPVPVPPPTYTLKAKAERPAAPPAGEMSPDSGQAPEAVVVDSGDAGVTTGDGERQEQRTAAYGT
jgi:hypothetical protein